MRRKLNNTISKIKGAIILSMFVGQISSADVARFPSQSQVISKIAFGSCLKQDQDLSVLSSIVSKNPDLFIFGGDNVYADTTNERRLIGTYNQLASSKDFQALKAVVPMIATWDDHDYGINDGGRNHPKKAMSQKVFLDFFGEPQNSERRRTEGVYTAYQFGPWNKRVNIVLLDTRSFRSRLDRYRGKDGEKHYRINTEKDAEILGAQQWAWLEKTLKEPATLTIIVSSIQIINDKHRFEKWGNFPHERQKLLDLIESSKLENVMLISGDRHFSELASVDLGNGKKLYEVTSSGMNYGGHFGKHEENPYRMDWVGDQGYAVLDINWLKSGPQLGLTFFSKEGNPVKERKIEL